MLLLTHPAWGRGVGGGVISGFTSLAIFLQRVKEIQAEKEGEETKNETDSELNEPETQRKVEKEDKARRRGGETQVRTGDISLSSQLWPPPGLPQPPADRNPAATLSTVSDGVFWGR